MTKIILTLLLLLLTTNLNALSVKRVTRVYDGDTITVDLSCRTKIFCKNIGIRIRGIDTPEIRDKRPHIKKKAYKARDYVRNRIKSAKHMELRNLSRGKYFRVIAEVWLDGYNLGEEMIDKGLAKAYLGGKKEQW